MARPEVMTSPEDLGTDFDLVLLNFKRAGDQMPRHTHPVDHVSALLVGRAAYLIGDKLVEYDAPMLVPIPAGVEHQITAMVDGTRGACIVNKKSLNGLRWIDL